MSMNCDYLEITPVLLGRLQKTPELVEAALNGDFAELPTEPLGDPNVESFLKFLPATQRSKMREMMQKMPADQMSMMLEQMAKQYAKVTQVNDGPKISRDELGESLSLDKAWHGVHYLLNGSPFPDDDANTNPIFGGTPIGPERGYGPARYFAPEACSQIADYLAALDMAQVRARFDPKAMQRANIYPVVWDEPNIIDWLMSSIADLRAFFQAVAARGSAVLAHIS